MWLRISESGKLQVLGNIFAFYHQHESSISANLTKMHKAKFEVIDEFKHLKYYNETVKQLKWSKTLEFLFYKKTQRPCYLARILYIDSFRTINRIYERVMN